jgi:hypothetical protein
MEGVRIAGGPRLRRLSVVLFEFAVMAHALLPNAT